MGPLRKVRLTVVRAAAAPSPETSCRFPGHGHLPTETCSLSLWVAPRLMISTVTAQHGGKLEAGTHSTARVDAAVLSKWWRESKWWAAAWKIWRIRNIFKLLTSYGFFGQTVCFLCQIRPNKHDFLKELVVVLINIDKYGYILDKVSVKKHQLQDFSHSKHKPEAEEELEFHFPLVSNFCH